MVISIANQKGGVSKTTTALNLAMELKRRKYKVLLIDLDAQENLSYVFQANRSIPSVVTLLKEGQFHRETIQRLKGLDFIRADESLSALDMILNRTGKEYRLKNSLTPAIERYDFIIIDTPPALNILTINALITSDYVLIPVQADIFSLQGMVQLKNTIDTVKKYCNPNLQILGVLATRYNARTILNRDLLKVISNTASKFGTTAFKIQIRESVAVKEAQAKNLDVGEYAPLNNASKDYRILTKEVLERVRNS